MFRTVEQNINNFSDEELVALINNGSSYYLHHLINRYIGIIKSKIHTFLPQGDTDDMVQEGLIALYSAVQVYKPELSSFSTFASVCIDRALYSYVRTFYRKKQIPQDNLVYFDGCFDVASPSTPETLLIEKEDSGVMSQKIKNSLSTFEYKILLQYLAGNSYENIAKKLNVSSKSVDNAMVRARSKIKAIKNN